MSFRPINKIVVVKLEELAAKTDSGLYLPTDANSVSTREATVVFANEESKVKAGDKILIMSFMLKETKINDEVYTLVNEDNIAGVFE